MHVVTLKRPAEFQRIRGGARWSGPAFLLEGKPRSQAPRQDCREAPSGPPAGPRFGFTISKKVGGAVVRNRIRRRLRAALRALDEATASPTHDYVVVARPAAADRDFRALVEDFARGLGHIGAAGRQGAAERPATARRATTGVPSPEKPRIPLEPAGARRPPRPDEPL